MTKLFLPRFFPTNIIVTVFVAGPAMRRIKHAPGLIPFAIRDAAIGIEPVAQT